MNNLNQLTKSLDKKIFGVAGGIANYMGVDPLIIRLLLVALAIMFDFVILVYLVLAFVLPESPDHVGDDHGINIEINVEKQPVTE